MKGKLLGIVLLVTAATAMASPRDVELKYRMSYAGLQIADVVDQLKFTEAGYEITSSATPTGLAAALNQPAVERISTGTLTANGALQMQRYHETRGDRVREINFDATAKMVTWSDSRRGDGSGSSNGGLVVDSLSYIYQGYVLGNLELENILFADARKLRHITVAKTETIDKFKVEYGTFAVIRQDLDTTEPERKRIAWYAPQLDHIPVRIRLVNGNNVVEFELFDLQYLN